MPPPHPAQYPVIERLQSHTDPANPQLKQSQNVFIAFTGDVLRIDFYRKFLKTIYFCSFLNGGYYASEYIRRQHRWGAASDIKCICTKTGLDFFAPLRCLSAYLLGIAGNESGIAPLAGKLRIKVAIHAETSAEGNVNVNHPGSLESLLPAISEAVRCCQELTARYMP